MTSLDWLLTDHHREMRAACAALLSETLADDPRNLCAYWRKFERSVEAHFAVEEQLLFPGFERVAPHGAQHLRADHERIRGRLAQIGLEVDLHQIRARTIQELIDDLDRHATAEDAHLYQWAATAIDAPAQAKVREALIAAR